MPRRDGIRAVGNTTRWLWALVVVAVSQPSLATPPTPDPGSPNAPARESSDADLADAHLKRLRSARQIPALQAAVLVRGDIVYSTAIGLADIREQVPADTATRLRIASISKAVTGTALARLASRGVIDLDAPIATYVPDLPEAWRSITPRQLAGHTSGIRHYRPGEALSNTRYKNLRDALVIFRDDPLEFTPGSGRAYSTYGFTLLGVVMEHAARKPFHEIVADEVLGPCRMTRTSPDSPDAESAAASYVLAPGGFPIPAPRTDHSYKVPGGGMLSTAEDLVRLGWASLEPGSIDREAIRILHQPVSTADGQIHPYALGWSVLGAGESIAIGHTGSQPGASCALWADRRSGVVVAILTNAQQARITFDDARALAAIFTPPIPPGTPDAGTPRPSRDDSHATRRQPGDIVWAHSRHAGIRPRSRGLGIGVE